MQPVIATREIVKIERVSSFAFTNLDILSSFSYKYGVLELRNIHKKYGSQTALSAISLSVRKGEFFSLLGPSGCGKSTLLRIIAGLETASSGQIFWDGFRVDQMPARQRPFNMVFQKYALFPHMTVFENVAFGLRIERVKGGELIRRVYEALDLVGMQELAKRYPETLSGGQAQRVALARSLVKQPACLLLDEPLAALDQRLREHMQTELRLLQRQLGLTFIFVTHDQEEAMLLSDRIAVMNAGRIEQVSEPRALYEDPQSIFSARFVGRRNEFDGKVVRQDGDWTSIEFGQDGRKLKGRLISKISQLMEDIEATHRQGVSSIRAFVRPEVLRPVPKVGSPTPGFNVVEGEILQVLFRGLKSEIVIRVGESQILRSLVDGRLEESALRVGERVGFEFAPSETHLFVATEQ